MPSSNRNVEELNEPKNPRSAINWPIRDRYSVKRWQAVQQLKSRFESGWKEWKSAVVEVDGHLFRYYSAGPDSRYIEFRDCWPQPMKLKSQQGKSIFSVLRGRLLQLLLQIFCRYVSLIVGHKSWIMIMIFKSSSIFFISLQPKLDRLVLSL